MALTTSVGLGRATEQELMKLDGAIRDLEMAVDAIGGIERKHLEKAMAYASYQVQPQAQKMLMQNYDSSGLGVRSGKLKRAIGESSFFVDANGKWFARIPGGYEDAYGKGGDFYAAAAAHQYGATVGGALAMAHQEKKRLGRKAAGNLREKKRALKKQMAKRGIKKSGGMSYIEPKEYFFLTGSQVARLKTRVFSAVNEWLAKFIIKAA